MPDETQEPTDQQIGVQPLVIWLRWVGSLVVLCVLIWFASRMGCFKPYVYGERVLIKSGFYAGRDGRVVDSHLAWVYSVSVDSVGVRHVQSMQLSPYIDRMQPDEVVWARKLRTR